MPVNLSSQWYKRECAWSNRAWSTSMQVLSYKTFERIRSVAVHTVAIMSVDVAPGDRSAVKVPARQLHVVVYSEAAVTQACASAGSCVLGVLMPVWPLLRPKSWLLPDTCHVMGMYKRFPSAQMHSGLPSANGVHQLSA